MPLPNELYHRCRATLLKCCEFDGNASLRSVFVTDELSPFLSGLPEAASKGERVDACLAFLMDKRLSDGRTVLPLFFATLCERYSPGDALRDELRTLVEESKVVRASSACLVQGRYLGIPLPPQPCFAHPYPLQANFTGRFAERQMLTDWLTNDKRPIFALVAIGGMGKSSLVWYWLQNDVDCSSFDGLLWWSFYEGPPSFLEFLDCAVVYLSSKTVDPTDISSSYEKTRLLVNLLREHNFLLILDGFERELRAYASLDVPYQQDDVVGKIADLRGCIDLNAGRLLKWSASESLRSKILLTSRLSVSDLEGPDGYPLAGCLRTELKSIELDDAVDFFHAQGIRGNRGEIRAACEPYGNHPLSLRLLVGHVAHDKQQPGDIAVAPRYSVIANLKARQHHILEVMYNSLSDELRMLLSQFAAFRSSVDYHLLAMLNPFHGEPELNGALEELIKRGLVLWDRKGNRYDLHPVVRSYAYDRLLDKEGVHTQLRNYFSSLPHPERIETRSDLQSLIELFHHTVNSGQYEEGISILRTHLRKPLMRQTEDNVLYQRLLLSFFPNGIQQPSVTMEEGLRAWLYFELAGTYVHLGRPSLAVSLYQEQIAIREAQQDWGNLATGLGHLAARALLPMGQLASAHELASKAVDLSEQKLGGVYKSEYKSFPIPGVRYRRQVGQNVPRIRR